VAEQFPQSQLGVADLSNKHGGALASHHSHQNGRDVDLIYYALDANSQPFAPDEHMAFYNAIGKATYATAPAFVKGIPERYFDLARNWALVKAMLNNPSAKVEYIFVSPRVRYWLLRYAHQMHEDKTLIHKAQLRLHAPRKSKGHNDHMHVRIACSHEDIEKGRCKKDSAPKPRSGMRWHRKVRCPAPLSKKNQPRS